MKFKDKLKSYKFWVSLTSAVIIFLQVVGKEIGFSISEQAITNITMAFCGILVLLGFIDDDRNKTSSIQSIEEENLNNDKEKEEK